MDIEELIDERLKELDESSKKNSDLDDFQDNFEEDLNFNEETYKKELKKDDSKWLELFLSRTSEQASKTKDVIKDVDDTINIVSLHFLGNFIYVILTAKANFISK